MYHVNAQGVDKRIIFKHYCHYYYYYYYYYYYHDYYYYFTPEVTTRMTPK